MEGRRKGWEGGQAHLPKQMRTRPSHSSKFTGGGGLRGSMRTTLESTLGGGLKLLRPTFSKWCTLRQQQGWRGTGGGQQQQAVSAKCTALPCNFALGQALQFASAVDMALQQCVGMVSKMA
jgi:hypothetical protein